MLFMSISWETRAKTNTFILEKTYGLQESQAIVILLFHHYHGLATPSGSICIYVFLNIVTINGCLTSYQ
jgi:hypothetical protein